MFTRGDICARLVYDATITPYRKISTWRPNKWRRAGEQSRRNFRTRRKPTTISGDAAKERPACEIEIAAYAGAPTPIRMRISNYEKKRYRRRAGRINHYRSRTNDKGKRNRRDLGSAKSKDVAEKHTAQTTTNPITLAPCAKQSPLLDMGPPPRPRVRVEWLSCILQISHNDAILAWFG